MPALATLLPVPLPWQFRLLLGGLAASFVLGLKVSLILAAYCLPVVAAISLWREHFQARR